MEDFIIYANYYYNWMFNVTHISPLKTIKNSIHKENLKAPSHNWEHLINSRLKIEELHSMDWINAVGIGTVLGYNNLRALDIDDCEDFSIIQDFLNILRLPTDYEWVVLSGSGRGFHIIFFAEDHGFQTKENKIKAFKPNTNHSDKFKHIELRWIGHLVLPPSIHPSYRRYEFLNKSFPNHSPSTITITNLKILLQKYCYGKYTNNLLKLIDNYIESDDDSGAYIESDDDSGAYIESDDDSGTYIESDDDSGTYIESDDDSGTYIESDDDSGTYIESDDFHPPFYLFFDTETTGVPLDWSAPISDLDNWPRLVQIAWILFDNNGNLMQKNEHIVKPNGFSIPIEASNIHGITTESAKTYGTELDIILNEFEEKCSVSDYLVAHNISFDEKILGAEFLRVKSINPLSTIKTICTMAATTEFCAIPGHYGYKWPKLSELHVKLFGTDFEDAHDASSDIKATARCFWELRKRGIV